MTDLTVTLPSTTLFYGGDIAAVIIPQNQYVNDSVKETLPSGYNAPKPTEDLEAYSEDFVLSQLRPLERWRYVAKYNRGEFIIWILALLGGMYMLINGAVHLGLSIFPSARAQNDTPAIAGSLHDAFDWYGGALLGICLLCSLGIIVLAQKESKISFGKETTRTIIGFVAGFLTCGKQR
jgi:hypothetical protein